MDHNTPDNEMWDWQGTENFLEDSLDTSKCLWSSVNQNEDTSFPFVDEFTPVKAVGDIADYVNIFGDTSKELEKCGEHSSQVKRRRLQFNVEENKDLAEEGLSNLSQKVSGYSECTSSSSIETLDQSSVAWLASCFNEDEVHYSPNAMESNVQIDVTEFCKTQSPPKCARINQDPPVRSCSNVFKGRKSYIQTPAKLATSVVYPFGFIKPCGVHGDMTLKDINQRLRTPPKLKQNNADPSSYLTSAFSGKPVVGRTTLSTDGGKGSITIMRTKG